MAETVEELRDRLQDMDDLDELQALRAVEHRVTAREAIDERIAEITGVEPLPENPDETIYSRDDLVAGAGGFGVSSEAMAGALHVAGLSEATHAQAVEALQAFSEREV